MFAYKHPDLTGMCFAQPSSSKMDNQTRLLDWGRRHQERYPALKAPICLPRQRPGWMWLTSNLTQRASQPFCQAGLPSSTKVQQIHARSMSPLSYTSKAGLSTLGTFNKTSNSCVTYGRHKTARAEWHQTRFHEKQAFIPNKAVSAYVLLPCSNYIGQHLFKLPS